MNTARLLSSTFLFVLLCGNNVPAADRPNILWLSCEDISAHLGCYGYPLATTPHLDQFAQEGVRYKNAFVCAGVCAPCRSTIITGMYQTSIGTHHMRCKAQLPDHIRPFTFGLRDAGYYCTNNSKEDYQFKTPKKTWDVSSRKAHWKNRPDKSQPFFSVFNFTGCHESGIADSSKYAKVTAGLKKHDREAVAAESLPPYYPPTKRVKEDWGRYYDTVTAMDVWFGEKLQELEDAGIADDTIVIFWSDHGVGLPRAKRWLYDSGMHVPLLVRIPKKYRVQKQGEPGTVSDQLVSLMDLGPTTLNLAGVEIPSNMFGKSFLGPNCPPPREYVFGARDRMDERYDIIRAVRDKRFKYIRNYEPYKTFYQYMNTPEKGATMREIRRVAAEGNLTGAAKLFMAPEKANEELYDTQSDPHELQNLTNKPEMQSVLQRMRAAHLDWVTRTGDLGLVPEPEIAAREKILGSSHAVLTQPDPAGSAPLINRLRDAAAASLAGDTAKDNMLQHTDDTDAAVRYWGAIGLGNIASDQLATQNNVTQRLQQLLQDPSNVVRVAAGRALCRLKMPDQALPVMADVLDNGTQWERLHAAIALDEIDQQAMPVLAIMKRNKAYREGMVAKGKYTVRVLNRALNQLEGTKNTVP